ncbi:MAG: FRG domain-containing protein [Candidatus Dadabacteria bacterium]|nr:FRG domain-containing protein [Candidatus Dadabacteria bacterium]
MSQIEEVTITSLEDYLLEVKKLYMEETEKAESAPRFIYRGQKNASWKLQSSATVRLLNESELEFKYPFQISSLFLGYLDQMVDEVRLTYPNIYKNLDHLEIMAHLQHNRVATGLIDFTYSSLVALWFACEEDNQNEEGKYNDGKVFCMNVNYKDSKIEEIRTKDELKKDVESFFKNDGRWYIWQPAIGNPNVETQRLTMQQSVFLFGMPSVEEKMLAKVFIVLADNKRNMHQELEYMGITEKNLFSDLAGFIERNSKTKYYNKRLGVHYYDKKLKRKRSFTNLYQRGMFYLALEEYKKAIEDFTEATGLVDVEKYQKSIAYVGSGWAKSRLDMVAEAVMDYTEAIRLNSQNDGAYTNRGWLQYKLGKHAEAINDLKKSLEINSGNLTASNILKRIEGELKI